MRRDYGSTAEGAKVAAEFIYNSIPSLLIIYPPHLSSPQRREGAGEGDNY